MSEGMVKQIIDLQQRIKELENPWINVKDRLPTNLATLDLVCIGSDLLSGRPDGVQIRRRGYYSFRGEFRNNETEQEVNNVTHWMPLTPLPKEPQ